MLGRRATRVHLLFFWFVFFDCSRKKPKTKLALLLNSNMNAVYVCLFKKTKNVCGRREAQEDARDPERTMCLCSAFFLHQKKKKEVVHKKKNNQATAKTKMFFLLFLPFFKRDQRILVIVLWCVAFVCSRALIAWLAGWCNVLFWSYLWLWAVLIIVLTLYSSGDAG